MSRVPDIELEQISEGPIGLGTVIRRRHKRYGQPTEGTMEVVEFEPNRLVGVKIRDGDLETNGRATLVNEGPDKTTVTLRRRVWAPAVKAAGIPWCTPHALRHIQAALLIQAGEHPLVVVRRLGHTSVKTVLDLYGHLFEGMDEAAAARLDEKSRTRRAPSEVVQLPPGRKTQPG
jgi:integrase